MILNLTLDRISLFMEVLGKIRKERFSVRKAFWERLAEIVRERTGFDISWPDILTQMVYEDFEKALSDSGIKFERQLNFGDRK